MSYNATAFSLLQQRIADAETANAELALAMGTVRLCVSHTAGRLTDAGVCR